LEPIAPGGIEIWDENSFHWVGFGSCGEMGYFKWKGIFSWPWKFNES